MAKKKNNTSTFGGGLRASGAAGSYKAKNYLFAIAINDYEHIDKLHNCVRDAEAVIELLTEDFEFEREEVCFVCSGHLHPSFQDVAVLEETADGSAKAAKATRSVILKELRRIARSIEKDQQEDPELKVNLLLYYSGHGWYDDFLDQGYWIPVDSELDDYSKYISNSTIRDFLSGINTHHTLLLSDSCFSGSLFASGTGKSLASTRLEKDPSRWGITAGRNEVVSDGEVGKQSPFIDSFLTELRAADTISVQDLSTKILERVASNDKQTPRGEPLRVRGHKGGQFVFRKKANAERHYDAGHLILRLARHQPEYARFRAAANQFGMAGRLTKKKEDQARYLLWEVRSLAYAGLFKVALETLTNGLKKLRKNEEVKQFTVLKQALGWLQEPDQLSEKLMTETLSIEENWSEILASLYRTKHPKKQNCHLFEVAINEYAAPNIPKLNGCINDAELVGDTLMDTFGKQRFRTKYLYDQEATKAKIVQGLEDLQKNVQQEDWVFIHFSCINFKFEAELVDEKGDSPFLVSFDATYDQATNAYQSTIGYQELHELFEAIPSKHKVIILDTDSHEAYYELAEKGNYTLLMATDKGELAKETRIGSKTHGLFSYALAQALAEKGQSSAQQKPLRIKKAVKEKVEDQHPVFIRAEDFFTTASTLSFDTQSFFNYLLTVFYGTRNSQVKRLTNEQINAIEHLELTFSAAQWQRLAELVPSTDNEHQMSFYERSLQLYQDSEAEESRSALLEIYLQLGSLSAQNGDIQKAVIFLTKAKDYLLEGDQAKRDHINRQLSHFNRLTKKKKYALLVGISKYKELTPFEGIDEDLESWKKTLLDLGYEEENITVLQDTSATRDQIFSAFKTLAKKAKTNPAFFFFRGQGLVKNDDMKEPRGFYTYEQGESGKHSSILFSELAELSEATRHLTVVLDADFTEGIPIPFTTEQELPPWQEPFFGNTQWLAGIYDEATASVVHHYNETKEEGRGALSTLLTSRLQQEEGEEFVPLNYPDLAPQVMLSEKWVRRRFMTR